MALNAFHRIFFNLTKKASYHADENSMIKVRVSEPFLSYRRLKLNSRVFLAGHDHIVAMVNDYRATKSC